MELLGITNKGIDGEGMPFCSFTIKHSKYRQFNIEINQHGIVRNISITSSKMFLAEGDLLERFFIAIADMTEHELKQLIIQPSAQESITQFLNKHERYIKMIGFLIPSLHDKFPLILRIFATYQLDSKYIRKFVLSHVKKQLLNEDELK